MVRSTHGNSHKSDKMLPKCRAHGHIFWYVFVDDRWVVEDKGDISSVIRSVYKKRHRKKFRQRATKLIQEELNS